LVAGRTDCKGCRSWESASSSSFDGDRRVAGTERVEVAMTKTEIQCRCGNVKLELTGEPRAQLYCHCDDCQAVHGAAYVPAALYPADGVRVTSGAPQTWQLRTTPRASCSNCGTRLFAESHGMRIVNASLLPAEQRKPSMHIHCRFAVLPVRDSLPHFRSVPAAFGGSDDLVGW
jgi:hypothetical protein